MITTQFIKMFNKLVNEYIVQARVVNTQTVGFNDWCVRMANGSTVTAADVAAVMQQIEDKLPEILSLNAKVICSPGGLIFRPKVSGSITQSELKARLTARKAAETDPEKAAKIDPDRALTTSDLSISDCTVSIEVDLPKDWSETFKRRAELKRVKSSGIEDASGDEDDNGGGTSEGSGSGGTNSGSNIGGNSDGNSGTETSSNPHLTINRSGTGSSSVTVGGNAVSSGGEVVAGSTVNISVTPAADATPTASLNGNSVALTENEGVYTGSFTMPESNATLAINSGGSNPGGDAD